MAPTRTFDDLIEDLRNTSDQINQLKENLRRNRVNNPEGMDPSLQSALTYWETCKQNIEKQLRQFR